MMQDFNGFIDNLAKLISFESVLDKSSPAFPFGEQNKKALNFFLELADSFGFNTVNYDDYIGEISFGEGQEIGIIGHLDVVPCGEGWDYPPYQLTKVNDIYYGRGVTDDKTPLLICLYALKKLKDSGVKPNKKFRLFVGCNEESGWEDVDYLKSKTTLPTYGFSPDGNFPLSYAEKGMYIVTFTLPKLKNFGKVRGGTVINAVCGKATCKPLGDFDRELIYKHKLCLLDGEIISIGKSAHGSCPELGVNALDALFRFFLDCGERVSNFVQYVIDDRSNLRGLSCEQGVVTMSPDIVYETDEGLVVKCDLRLPAPLTIDLIKQKLDTFGISYNIEEKHPPFMAEKDSELARKLLEAYRTVTGEKNAKPLAMGGSTFARVFDKGYSFGVDELFNEKLKMHQPNECMSQKTMLTAYEIYKRALFLLAK